MNNNPRPCKRDYSKIIRLGLPVLLTQIGIITVNFADTMMVGEYGTKELASAAFVNNLFFTVITILIGFASGITPLVGAYYSRKMNHSVGQTLRVALILNIAVAIFFTALMGATYFLLDHFGQPAEIMHLIRPYYLIILCTLLPSAIFNAFQQTSNGVTNTAMPMWIILATNALNILGNYALIYGHFGAPELGLNGAGISTLTARITGAVTIALIVLNSKQFKPYRQGLRASLRQAVRTAKLFATSWPVMLQVGVECGLWAAGGIVCGWFGTVQLASYQVIVTISQLGFMTYMSFAVATSVIVSNKRGLNDFAGMRRTALAGLHVILAMCVAASLFFAIFSEKLLQFFTSDPDVILAGTALIVPMILYQFLDGTQISYANSLRGTGNVKPLLAVAVISYVIVGIPALLLLSVTAGLRSVGVYYSFNVALLVAAALQYTAFRRTVNKLETSHRSR